MNSINKRRCRCGGGRFNAHQLTRHDVVVDVNGIFINDQGIYNAEKPYSPFTCVLCGEVYDELEDLDKNPIQETTTTCEVNKYRGNNNSKTSIIRTGNIELSDKVVVSDPCYDRSVWCMETDIAVNPGTYATYIFKKDEKRFGVRVAAIIAVHMDYTESINKDWEPYDCCVGVDSGQCGIFDDAVYPANEESGGNYDDEESFYGECCKLTLSNDQGGILKSHKGVVSSSGYGDGSYKLLCQYHEGERVALMIDFDLEKTSTIMSVLMNDYRD